MKRKLVTLILAASMAATGLCGCGGSTDSETASSEEESSEEVGDPDEIVVRFECFGTVPSDLQAVEDAINEITIPAINVKVDYECISAANYNNQIALDMTSGEKLDVFFTMDYTGQLSSNQLLDLTPYLEEYGQGIVDAVSEEWLRATSVGDACYAIPVICGKAATLNIAMRTDILEKYGFDPDFSQYDDFEDEGFQETLEQIEEIFATVKENEEDLIVLCNGGSNDVLLSYAIQNDSLTDGYGVLMGSEGWEVVDVYETEEYYHLLEKLREWYLAGYIKSDASTDTETATTYALAGRMFAQFSISETGLDTQLKASTGYDYTCIKIKTPMMTSTNLSSLAWAVSSTTEVPEAAVKFLNLAYTDKDLSNTMMYGVEGVHWDYAEDGTVDYAEGLSADNTGYPFSTYWEMPNSLIGTPLYGNSLDYNEVLTVNNKAATVSRAMGFSFDQSAVKSECSAVAAVLEEYKSGFMTGSLDLDENYDNFIQKLKDAGIDDIIAEKQSQLDAWCEENGIER